jgi:hypothetical protein
MVLMGTMIEGIFPHSLKSYEEIEALPHRLAPALAPLCALSYWKSVSELRADPTWSIEPYGGPISRLTPRQQWEAGSGGPKMFAPEKIHVDSFGSLLFGRHCLSAATGVKWWAAMKSPKYLEEVRDYFRTLARLLDSDAFILHRENGGASWVMEGLRLDQIEDQFIQGGAKRATDVDALRYSGPKIEETAYYYESVG